MLDWFYTYMYVLVAAHVGVQATVWQYFTIKTRLRQQICMLKYFENTLTDQYQIIYSYMLVDKSLGCSRCRSDAFKCFGCLSIWLSSCTFSYKCAFISFSGIYLYSSTHTVIFRGTVTSGVWCLLIAVSLVGFQCGIYVEYHPICSFNRIQNIFLITLWTKCEIVFDLELMRTK